MKVTWEEKVELRIIHRCWRLFKDLDLLICPTNRARLYSDLPAQIFFSLLINLSKQFCFVLSVFKKEGFMYIENIKLEISSTIFTKRPLVSCFSDCLFLVVPFYTPCIGVAVYRVSQTRLLNFVAEKHRTKLKQIAYSFKWDEGRSKLEPKSLFIKHFFSRIIPNFFLFLKCVILVCVF